MKDFDKEKLSTWELDMVTGGAKEPDQEEELRNRPKHKKDKEFDKWIR